MGSSFLKFALIHAIQTNCGGAMAACNVVPGLELAEIETGVKFALRASTAVFTGKVLAIDYVRAQASEGEERETQVIRVAAQSWWKGASSPMVTLITNHHRRADGVSVEAHEYPYEVDKAYLIYAQLDDDGLHANGCTRTKSLGAAAADIALLDAIEAEQQFGR